MANRYSTTRVNTSTVRFYDQAQSTFNLTNIEESMTSDQITYLGLNKAYTSNTVTVIIDVAANSILWQGTRFATPPINFPAQTKSDFQIFINGMIVETDAISSITDDGSNVTVIFNAGLNFEIDSSDEYMITGKLA